MRQSRAAEQTGQTAQTEPADRLASYAELTDRLDRLEADLELTAEQPDGAPPIARVAEITLERRRELRAKLRRTRGAEHLKIRAAIALTYWPDDRTDGGAAAERQAEAVAVQSDCPDGCPCQHERASGQAGRIIRQRRIWKGGMLCRS